MPAEQSVYLVIVPAVAFQLLLLCHFAVRRWAFDTALRWGWIVYLLAIPFAAISVTLWLRGAEWWYWVGGLLYLVWAIYGYIVEYVRHIEWRQSARWPVLMPYVLLYLATCMFYWWPVLRLSRALWVVLGVLYVAGSVLNITSHRKREP